jgi:hypothetical protein
MIFMPNMSGFSSKGLTRVGLKSFANPLVPSGLGQSYAGGFYVGDIALGGKRYYIIVAPKATGESNLTYKNAQTAAPIETRTLNDGYAATEAMVNAGNSTVYPAAHFCWNLSIGGFTDWSMPARDELELCFRNLKPTTDNNRTDPRQTPSPAYPEGDVAGNMGRNANSIPEGANYTIGSPTRTAVAAFQSPGGAEFFISNFGYLTSTEISNANCWFQWFQAGAAGEQTGTPKDLARQVRAVRRVRYL